MYDYYNKIVIKNVESAVKMYLLNGCMGVHGILVDWWYRAWRTGVIGHGILVDWWYLAWNTSGLVVSGMEC